MAWDAALDEVAEQFLRAAQRYGSETVWPLFYAGTMGLVQRDGIERLRHVMRYSRQHSTICNTLVDAGWVAGVGAKIGPDPREMGEADLVIVWGSNPAATQVNVMTHIARARRERNASLIVVDPYRTSTAKVADMHLALKPGTDGALACAIMRYPIHDSCGSRLPAPIFRCARRARAAFVGAHATWASNHRPARRADRGDRKNLRRNRARVHPRRFSRSRNGSANVHAVACLATTVGGKWKYKGGGTFYSNGDIYKIDDTLIKGKDHSMTTIRVFDQSRAGPVLTGDALDLRRGPAGHGDAGPEHESRGGLPRDDENARRLHAQGCSCACTSSS
jgi:anaerobic selenocysteine-containing dehydrogenase